MIAVAAVAFALTALALYCATQRISPDGEVYLAAGSGMSVPRPFHFRPVLPAMCGTRMRRWRLASMAGVFVASVCVGALAFHHGASTAQAAAATALFSALPIVRSTVELPVLVDGPAMALAGLSAVAAVNGYVAAAVVLAMIGAAVKEHVPVFAALAAWSLWPLVGVAVTLALMAWIKPARATHPSQSTPMSYARTKQAPRLLVAGYTVLPWGVCLAVLFAPTLPVLASLSVGYAMLFVSADSTRVYQWGAMPVCVAAACAIPEAWLPFAVVAHVCNPWQGEL